MQAETLHSSVSSAGQQPLRLPLHAALSEGMEQSASPRHSPVLGPAKGRLEDLPPFFTVACAHRRVKPQRWSLWSV